MLTKAQLAEYLNIFGQNIRRHRAMLKMSYDQVESKTGISKSIMSRIENGQTSPSFETFLKLHLYMNINTSFFETDLDKRASDDRTIFDNLTGGLKFKRINFPDRPAVSAEILNIEKEESLYYQSRRSCEENVMIISGECLLFSSDVNPIRLVFGEIYTIPLNRQSYDISSLDGAKLIRITVPLSSDQSVGHRYINVLGRKARRTGIKNNTK